MSKQPIIEYMPFVPERVFLNESKNNSNVYAVQGVLQRAESKNQNGRIYPRSILEREVKKYDQKFVSNRNALGELDHPDSSVVSLKNVSHNIREIFFEGNDVKGVVEILPTPAGNILKSLFESKVTVGISSRGLGSVKRLGEGTVEVQDDFELIAFDFVSNPSTHGAFLTSMNESAGASDLYEEYMCNEYCKSQELMRNILMELQ